MGGLGFNSRLCHILYHFPINLLNSFRSPALGQGYFCLFYLASKLTEAMSVFFLVIQKELFLRTSVWFHLETLCLIMASSQVH